VSLTSPQQVGNFPVDGEAMGKSVFGHNWTPTNHRPSIYRSMIKDY